VPRRAPAHLFTALLLFAARPAAAAEPFGRDVYYFGDLHAHSGYSGDAGSSDLVGTCDGSCGAFADLFTTARANDLDFVAITDHVNGSAALSASEFDILNAAVLAAHDPADGFVTLPAAEVWFTERSTGDRIGHKTLLLFGDDTTLAGLSVADVRVASGTAVDSCEAIWDWMDSLVAGFGDALLLPHHPSVRMPMQTDWGCYDPTYEPAVEIYSEHGNGLDDGAYDAPGEGIYADSTTLSALDPDTYGLMLGFIAGTDSHDSRPGGVCDTDTEQPTHLYGGGLTVAVLDAAEAFDRAAIHTAIVDHRTYVTTGPLLPMSVSWSANGRVLGGLGEAVSAPASFDLDVEVTVPVDRARYVTAVDVVGPDTTWSLTDDGAGEWTGAVPAGEVPAWLFVAVEIDGAAWYAPEGCDDGGDDVEWLWGSPSPLTLWEDDADADGVSSLADDCDDGDAAVYPGAAEVWYDGVDQNCDRADDYDQDADGDRATGWGGDCDDTDPTIHGGATDTWYDGTDTNCDGADDYDQDADGARALGWGDDCDDVDASVYPGAPDAWYDGTDSDCDRADDYDQDGDGQRRLGEGLDCDDTDPATFSGALEVWYDGVDQDCDAGSDYDQDADGFEVDAGGDCDDTRADVSPAAVDTWYDGLDQDCDGANDYDQDADGFEADTGGDCDDTRADVSPAAVDTWYDGLDQDCDGANDYDQDADGFEADTGGDCDDTRADVSPAAAERWYDGFDQDCDAADDYDQDADGVRFLLDCDDTDPARGPCPSAVTVGCATTSGPSTLAPLLLAGLLLTRRRARG